MHALRAGALGDKVCPPGRRALDDKVCPPGSPKYRPCGQAHSGPGLSRPAAHMFFISRPVSCRILFPAGDGLFPCGASSCAFRTYFSAPRSRVGRCLLPDARSAFQKAWPGRHRGGKKRHFPPPVQTAFLPGFFTRLTVLPSRFLLSPYTIRRNSPASFQASRLSGIKSMHI